MLSDTERDTLLPLSVFRNGFDRRAAGDVAQATPRTLRSLVSKSWLQRANGGRLALHELLRQYAADRLAHLSAEEAAVRQQHSRYFRSWIRRQEAKIKSPTHEDALARIDLELENIKFACEYAIVQLDLYDVADAVGGCGQFYRWACRYREGADFFADLLRCFQVARQQMVFSETDPTATQTALLLELTCGFGAVRSLGSCPTGAKPKRCYRRPGVSWPGRNCPGSTRVANRPGSPCNGDMAGFIQGQMRPINGFGRVANYSRRLVTPGS